MTAFIDIRHITYTYPGRRADARPALNDLSLRIEKGEYIAIVGANGSGKSTLARHLNALLIPQDGYVRVAGRSTRDPAHHPEIRRAVGMVFQRPDDQVVGTVVAHDVAFGLENLELPVEEIRSRVETTLRALSLWEERERPPHMLSAGQMQRLALAGILAMRPTCIVFDEATAMLDPAGRRATREMMRDLHQQGLTILTITHRMEETLDADRIVVLHEGCVVLDDTPEALFEQPAQLRQLGLDVPPAVELTAFLSEALPQLKADVTTAGQLIDAIDQLEHRTPPQVGEPAQLETTLGDRIIQVEGLGHTYMRDTPFARRALHGVNLAVEAGGAQGMIGATGSGKSTLLQHLNGLLRPQEGHVHVLDYDLADTDIDVRVVRRTIGLVFQRPEGQIFEQYVGDEIAYGPRLAGLEGNRLRERVRWAMDVVGLDFEAFKDRFTFALSGGEQRKVALASILALQPQILLLDEPTAGLDPGSKAELMTRLSALRTTGMTLVLSSHEMEDIAALAEHVTVLCRGTTPLNGPVNVVFGDAARLQDWGLEPPVVTQVSEGLRARDWSVPVGTVDREELREALVRHMPTASWRPMETTR